jgi:hypothetical protein
MRDAVNKAARFIINRCFNDRVGNLVIGWNEGQKNASDMGNATIKTLLSFLPNALLNA